MANKGLESDPSTSPPAQEHFTTILIFTEFKHISYSKGLAALLIDDNYQKISSE